MQELINSVLAQQGVDVDLLVRDDGSSDGATQQILDDYQNRGKLEWYQGKNIKPARSFMQLVQDSHDADFYAFADEDDFWQPEKLQVAVNALQPYENQPAMYFCRTQLTDAKLNPIPSPPLNPYLTFGESLVYKFMPGCTMVFNRRLRDIVRKYKPEYLTMHDIWVYSIAEAINAKIIYDQTPHILYRQHGDNTIGQGQGEMHEWHLRLKRIKRQERYHQACELQKGYSSMMDKENANILATFIDAKHSFKKRLKLIFDPRFKCANNRTYKLFRLSVLFNLY